MDAITALGMLNTGANLVNNDSERQQKYTLDLMKHQHNYNIDAMREQEAASLRMFQATGYEAKVKQLKEAGLNPALIYGMGGAGGGTTGNISAPQVSQGSAPNVAAATANKTASVGMALQLAKLQSEIKVNESVAEANKAAAATQTAQVPKIEAETQNLKQTFEMIGTQIKSEQIKQIGWSLDNNQKKIEVEIADKGKFANIQRIVNLSEESYWDMLKAMEEAGSAKAKNTIDQATINTTIAQYNANLKKTVVDIIVAKTQGAINIERAKQITNEIEQRWDEVRATTKNADTRARELEEMVWSTLQNNNAAMDRTEAAGISAIIQTIIGLGGYGILKGASSSPAPIKGFSK